MLKIKLENKNELITDCEKAEKLIKELLDLFYKMDFKVTVEEEPSEATDDEPA